MHARKCDRGNGVSGDVVGLYVGQPRAAKSRHSASRIRYSQTVNRTSRHADAQGGAYVPAAGVHNRLRKWTADGTWGKVFTALLAQADAEGTQAVNKRFISARSLTSRPTSLLSFIRVVNQADGQELTRYDLGEDAFTETAMILGEVYRHGGEGKFRAVGPGLRQGCEGYRSRLWVNVSQSQV